MESSSSVLVFNKYSLETKTNQLWTTQGYFLRHDLIQESGKESPEDQLLSSGSTPSNYVFRKQFKKKEEKEMSSLIAPACGGGLHSEPSKL